MKCKNCGHCIVKRKWSKTGYIHNTQAPYSQAEERLWEVCGRMEKEPYLHYCDCKKAEPEKGKSEGEG